MDYKKSLLGSLIALILGTSCCWISALVIWLVGATLTGFALKFIGDVQIVLIGLGVILLTIAIARYIKMRKIKSP